MERCFVIQPFDKGRFDKRYEDIFQPAITKADLEPYRIDEDMSVRIPIEDIEKGISESAICFAEITTNNPNVWYELGFAFACGKDVVMICSDERADKFPFDIQHRHIITYKTSSKSDFETLEEAITKKIKALLQKGKTVSKLSTLPVVETEGLNSHEIALLVLLMENQISADEVVSTWYLKEGMGKAGYTDLATSVAIRTLLKKQMIKTFMQEDAYNNNESFPACKLTERGEEWILNNQDQLVFRKDNNRKDAFSDDLPF